VKDKCEDNVKIYLLSIGCSSCLRTVLMQGFCKQDYETSAHIKAGVFFKAVKCASPFEERQFKVDRRKALQDCFGEKIYSILLLVNRE